jgi:predicted RNA-binding Zn-ribbon protein involved in translation (DUF1610 family)
LDGSAWESTHNSAKNYGRMTLTAGKREMLPFMKEFSGMETGNARSMWRKALRRALLKPNVLIRLLLSQSIALAAAIACTIYVNPLWSISSRVPRWLQFVPVILIVLITNAYCRDILRSAARKIVREQRDRFFCKTCGYDLRASPDQCPECGERVVGRKSQRLNSDKAGNS